jgi:hypothetical protein
MYEVSERILSQPEKDFLANLKSPPPGPFKGLELRLAAHSFAVILLGVFLGIILKDLRWNYSAGAVVCLVAYILYIFIQARTLILRPLGSRRCAMAVYRDYQRAVHSTLPARVQRIRSNEVVQIDHDEGSFYLYATGPASSFWTSVQGPEKSGPNTDFEIFQIPGVRGELGPICHGQRLKPRSIIEFNDHFETFDFEKLPEDGVIHASIASFLENTASSKPAT